MTIYATPFDETFVPFLGVGVYLVVIFLLYQFMRNKKAFELAYLLAAHNFFLCFLSLIMAIGVSGRVLTVLYNFGPYHLYCGTFSEEDEKLYFWSNLFYLSKYYELVDTVFVVLRKKPLTLLHIWHHCSVVYVCWLATRHQIVMGWITCYQNCMIHVIMYYYYAIQSLEKRDFWWRRYLTSLQIVQFVLDIFSSIFFPYFLYYNIPCKGTLEAWLVANVTGFSFFLLFLNFYYHNYRKEKKQ